jgi:AbrB family looped-hinge helix DNA binding protein
MNRALSDISTTKMTSKGQVVIPEEIREHMHLSSGTKFIVMATDDSIIFKKINPLPQQEIQHLLTASQKIAKTYGLKQSDIAESIKEVRNSARGNRNRISEKKAQTPKGSPKASK